MGLLDKLLGRTKKTENEQTAGSSMGMQQPPSAMDEPAAPSAPPAQDEPDRSGDETPPA
jgi:hypothetical protein